MVRTCIAMRAYACTRILGCPHLVTSSDESRINRYPCFSAPFFHTVLSYDPLAPGQNGYASGEGGIARRIDPQFSNSGTRRRKAKSMANDDTTMLFSSKIPYRIRSVELA